MGFWWGRYVDASMWGRRPQRGVWDRHGGRRLAEAADATGTILAVAFHSLPLLSFDPFSSSCSSLRVALGLALAQAVRAWEGRLFV